MRKNLLNRLLLGFIIVASFACKTKKTAVQSPPSPPVAVAAKPVSSSSAEALKKIKAKQVSYNTLAIKAKADLNVNNSSNDVSMNIRIKSGEIIWVSVTAIAGLEVARAMITPDSIKVMNRIQNEYMHKPFSYIHQFAGKNADFNTVQGLLTANALPGTLTPNAAVTLKNGQSEVNGNLSGWLYRLLFNAGYNLTETNLNDQRSGQKLTVNYDNFLNVSGMEIPHSVTINSAAQSKSLSIALKYTSVLVNEPVDFPFNVPKRFTVKN